MKRFPRARTLPLLAFALLACASGARAQARRADFRGSWNYAVYAKDKSELPPAFRDMGIEEVPAYAIDITIKQRGSRLTATCGVVARYLARIDDCGFDATARNGAAQFTLKSNFGGTATVRLTLRGDSLSWKVVRRRGVSYFPEDVVLRRLKPGELP
ncbi:MAG TPA: hypothetical protein VF508_13125, partial [Pyrinomonadaceae bacterium]